MDTTTIIALAIILSIILIVALVVMVAGNQARKLKNRLLEELTLLAKANSLHITRTQVFRDRIIGIDDIACMLVYVKHTEDTYRSDVVDIASVSHCEIVKAGSRHTETSRNGKTLSEEHIREILLQLNHGNDIISSIVFYSEIEDGGLDMQQNKAIAEDWKKSINDLRKNKR